MSSKQSAPEITELACRKCKATMSGPDPKALKDHMAEHVKNKHRITFGKAHGR